jgi:membrane associated rhomboid family serine protease
MTSTPVGMRCPECSRQRTQVRTMGSLQSEPRVTYVLIGISVIAFLAVLSGGTRLYDDFAILGWGLSPDGKEVGVEAGQYWRLVTGAFLHAEPPFGFVHVGFNMYLLFLLGSLLEPALGPVRFAALYFAALLAGSFGALLLDPNANTVGASGAVFGLMGAALVEMRRRGIDPMQTGIGGLLLMNLVITFLPGFNISIGGHLGGLAGGVLAALALSLGDRRRSQVIGVAGCVLIGAVAVAGAIAVSAAPAGYPA